MKNRISKGLCLFSILFSLFCIALPVAFSQSAYADSTYVTAHIEPEKSEESEKSEPMPSSVPGSSASDGNKTPAVSPGGDKPAKTGDSFPWQIVGIVIISGSMAVLIRAGQKKSKLNNLFRNK